MQGVCWFAAGLISRAYAGSIPALATTHRRVRIDGACGLGIRMYSGGASGYAVQVRNLEYSGGQLESTKTLG